MQHIICIKNKTRESSKEVLGFEPLSSEHEWLHYLIRKEPSPNKQTNKHKNHHQGIFAIRSCQISETVVIHPSIEILPCVPQGKLLTKAQAGNKLREGASTFSVKRP